MMKLITTLILTGVLLTACGQSNPQATKTAGESTPSTSNTVTTTDSTNTSTQNPKDSTEDTQYYGDYQMDPEDQFNILIHNNPLDQAYYKEYNEFQNSKDFSTSGWVALETKYMKLWDTELSNTMEHLKSKLSASQYVLLQQSQTGWKTYDEQESRFVEDTFLKDAHFGSQGQVSASSAKLSRTRERTIQLMEYYYELNEHQLQFVYQ